MNYRESKFYLATDKAVRESTLVSAVRKAGISEDTVNQSINLTVERIVLSLEAQENRMANYERDMISMVTNAMNGGLR